MISRGTRAGIDDRTRSDGFVRQVTTLRTDLYDAENAQRGFVITGDPIYLAPYGDAVERVRGDIETLQQLVAPTEPGQQELVATVTKLTDLKLQQLATSVTQRRDGGFEAARDVLRDPSAISGCGASAQLDRSARDRRAPASDHAGRAHRRRAGGRTDVHLGRTRRDARVRRAGRLSHATHLTRRLVHLSRSADRYGKGQLNERVTVGGNDEITDLAASFNAMAEAKAAQRRALEASEGQLRAIFANAADGIMTVDGDGLVQTVNPTAALAFGREAASMTGMKASHFFAEPEDHLFIIVREQLADPGHRPRELTIKRPDGSTIPVEMTKQRTQQDDKPVVICILRDVTERNASTSLKTNSSRPSATSCARR